MGRGRAHGTHGDQFEPAELEAALKPLARDKQPPCDFELEQYEKTKRSQGPDRIGLVHYFPLLSVILEFAPRGLPLKSLLRIVWNNLNTDFSIMTTASKEYYKGRVHEWLDMVTDRITIACRHIRDLASSQTRYADAKLTQLMDMLVLDDVAAPARPLASLVPHEAPPQRARPLVPLEAPPRPARGAEPKRARIHRICDLQ